jgi:Rho-type GTPase-activating protein 1/2
MASPSRDPHSPRNSANVKSSSSPSQEVPVPSHLGYHKSPTGSAFSRLPSKRKSIPYVADAFASDSHIPPSSRVHSPVSPRSPHHRPPSQAAPPLSLSVNIAPPPIEPALSSAPLMRPSNFGEPRSYHPYALTAHDSPSPQEEKNTLPIPPEEADGLRRRKSYDDGTRPLSTMFKQSGSPISQKGSPVTPTSTEGLSVPTSRSAKRHSITPGTNFGLDTTIIPLSGNSSPSSPLAANTLAGRSHTPNGRDSPQIRSPLRQEFVEDSSSRPISDASSSTVFRSSRSSPISSDNNPSRGQSVSRSRSVSGSDPNEKPPIRPTVSTEVKNDRLAASPAPSAHDDRSPKSPFSPNTLSGVAPLRTSSGDRLYQAGESHEPTSESSKGVTGSASRSRPNSTTRPDVPRNVEGWTDSEAESESGAKSTEKSDAPIPSPKVSNDGSPSTEQDASDDPDPDTSKADMGDLSDLSEGSPVEERMSHATFIAPALPPIRFSMSGNDFSELLSGAGGSSRSPWDYLTNYLEEEPITPPSASATTSGGGTIAGNGPSQIVSDDDRTAVWDSATQNRRHGTQHTKPLANGRHFPSPASNSKISESESSINRGRSSSESHAQSLPYRSSNLDEDTSQNSHSSMGSLPSSSRIAMTRQDSTLRRKQDKFQLVKRRLQEALTDANDRGAHQLKLDRGFVEAIIASMEQGNQNYALLKGRLDGVKVCALVAKFSTIS